MATDNELYAMMINYLEAEMAIHGNSVLVFQSYQPQLQSIEKDVPTGTNGQIFLFKVRDKRYGWKRIEAEYEDAQPLDQEFKMTYTQVMETTFQASCMSRQDPSDINSLTASDLLNDLAAILQMPDTITYFNDNFQVGIERVVDLPSTYIIDDKEQYEAVPNLEFVLTHKRAQVRRAPQVKSSELKVQRV